VRSKLYRLGTTNPEERDVGDIGRENVGSAVLLHVAHEIHVWTQFQDGRKKGGETKFQHSKLTILASGSRTKTELDAICNKNT
jgi:hypothetical protein